MYRPFTDRSQNFNPYVYSNHCGTLFAASNSSFSGVFLLLPQAQQFVAVNALNHIGCNIHAEFVLPQLSAYALFHLTVFEPSAK